MSARKKIGEILIEKKFITQEMLNEALEYQKQYGTGVTQYLIEREYINEEELATCISEQFRIPYIPVSVYNISPKVIDLVPVEVAEKHRLIPIDRVEDVLTVVMSDPLDSDVVEEVQRITGYKVQPFVGILSDIIKAIEDYYRVVIRDAGKKKDKSAPLFIDSNIYGVFERRKTVRLKINVDVHFPVQDKYKKSTTKDISRSGMLFESDTILPVGSYLTVQINLPHEVVPHPIAAVVQVVRVRPLSDGKFDIGANLISIAKEDSKILSDYVHLHGK
ncbi:MAG: PilZ domain-containing protein [Candidatus Omnitrophota bacterium]